MIRKIALALALLLMPATATLALDASAVPTKFPIPWGNSAGGSFIRSIPTLSQIGITNCAASLTDGFPPLTFVPATSGGCPPFGADFNGILKQITQWSQWQAAAGPVAYDGSFSTAIGGYPQGAIVASATTFGTYWLSLADNNTSNPDTGGANWQGLGAGVPTGVIMPFAGSTAPNGYVLCFGQAISRTTFAGLFAVIGTAYGSGDGSTTFNVPDYRGRVPLGLDNMGGSSASRLTSGGSGCAGTTRGAACGAQNQTISQGNLPNVNFNVTGTADPQNITINTSPSSGLFIGQASFPVNSGGTALAVTSATPFSISASSSSSSVSGSASSGGSGQALTTVPPGQISTYIIKL